MSDEQLVSPTSATQLAQAATAADHAAARGVFARYRADLAAETRRAQDADLARWQRYLEAVGITGSTTHWADDPTCWTNVSWGLVEGFLKWQEQEGYSLASIARSLATIRTYSVHAVNSRP